jgi:SAM-dependent methyltransferase
MRNLEAAGKGNRMTTTLSPTSKPTTPNYGIDAPSVLRNLFLTGGLCLLIGLLPHNLHFGKVTVVSRSFFWPAGFLIAEGLLFLLYVKHGKFRHRDYILSLHDWRGDEQVLDVGCGRGLLLVGAAKRLASLNGSGHATGIDLWSNVDMGSNSPEATQRNLDLEGVASRSMILSVPAQQMTFPDASFEVILSNLCLHNIYDRPTRLTALAQIVRVLAPGGVALISDYKHTREYADYFQHAGLIVERRRGSIFSTFPPLAVVIARKPAART